MVEGLSFRKMSMTVFCGLMQKGLKATEHMKKFQLYIFTKKKRREPVWRISVEIRTFMSWKD